MDSGDRIQYLFELMATEIEDFIEKLESLHADFWVPREHIISELDTTSELFEPIVKYLEDNDRLESYESKESLYYRTQNNDLF